MSRVAGIILAAGGSTRLGEPKQLLPLGGHVVIWHTLAAARQSLLDPLVLVVGAYADEVLSAVDTGGLTVVRNLGYQQGQSTSVKAGARALPDDVEAAVFLLGDQPLVRPEVIDSLILGWRDHRRTSADPPRGTFSIFQPHYRDDGPGNPVLIGRELFAELEELSGDTGARPLLQRHRISATPVPYERPMDIDTRDDYERVRRAFEAGR